MNVARILTEKGRAVVTAAPETTLGDIIKLLAAKKIGVIVVARADKTIQGIISERDIVRIIAAHGAQALDHPISDYMTKTVTTCTERDTVDWVMSEMTMRRFRHLPVVENGRMVGIISIGDVVKQRIAEVELEADSMRRYIATG